MQPGAFRGGRCADVASVYRLFSVNVLQLRCPHTSLSRSLLSSPLPSLGSVSGSVLVGPRCTPPFSHYDTSLFFRPDPSPSLLPSHRSVSGSFLEGVVFTGVYSDTTPRWYRDVGRPIVISMFLNTLLLHAQVGRLSGEGG